MRPFYIFITALFLGVISPYVLSEGMFMDGLWYATIAHNLSQGMGHMWDLFFTHTLNPHFHGHPPLAFALQSIWFQVFGNSVYIEKIYSVSTFFITAFIIVKIWQQIVDEESRKLAWLPLFLWVSVPVITWAATNNILENTMMIFTSLAVLLFQKSRQKNHYGFIMLAGLLLFLGVLTKGLPALFPLSFLLWQLVLYQDFRAKQFFVKLFLVLGVLVFLLVGMFYAFPESYVALKLYFQEQIYTSLTLAKTVDTRFFILRKMLMELLPILGMVLLVIVFSWSKIKKNKNLKPALMFFLLGLSGVVPIMVTLKQRGFYILPTYPFFAIAFALLILPTISSWIKNINSSGRFFKGFKIISYGALLGAVLSIILHANTYSRDAEKITDVKSIVRFLQTETNDTIIAISPELRTDWSLFAYFQRYGNIALDKNEKGHAYILSLKNGRKDSTNKKINLSLDLYELKEIKK